MKDSHPFIAFAHFVAVISLTMCASHPVLAPLSLVVALFYLMVLKGPRAALRMLGLAVAVVTMVSLFQLVFTHQGFTVIGHLFKNPITLESAIFGLSAGSMLAAILIWFSCFQEVVGSDRFLALFSWVIPTTAMMISMIFNFIDQVMLKAQQINTAHRALAYVDKSGETLTGDMSASLVLSTESADATASIALAENAPAPDALAPDNPEPEPPALVMSPSGYVEPTTGPDWMAPRKGRSPLEQLRWPVRLSSILMGWSMETGLSTAASMRARAYGAARRSSYLPLGWTLRDWVLLSVLAVLLAAAIVSEVMLMSGFLFYPLVSELGAPWLYLPIVAFCGFPIVYEGGIRLRWQLSSF